MVKYQRKQEKFSSLLILLPRRSSGLLGSGEKRGNRMSIIKINLMSYISSRICYKSLTDNNYLLHDNGDFTKFLENTGIKYKLNVQ